MELTAIAPWLGSKRNIVPFIVEECGQHSAYWSLFGGSLADILGKKPCSLETATDLHGELINLARVLAAEPLARQLYARLDPVLMHQQMIVEAQERVVARGPGTRPAPGVPDVDQAADYMLVSWCGRNGVAGTKSYNFGFCVRYTKNGGHAAKRWRSAVDSIPDWHDRLKNVTILNDDAFKVVERIEDSAGVVIYADPPYLVKGSKYMHDFTTWKDGDELNPQNDHTRLAMCLRRFQKTRVVVSYYDHPALDLLYPGWKKRKIEVTKSLVSGGKRDDENDTRAVEVLLVNEKRNLLF